MLFQVASTKASNGAITLAHTSIIMVYLLSLYTVYTVMRGSGAMGDMRDVVDMLETSRKREKRVTSNNFVGIDWSEFKVMEAHIVEDDDK